MSMSMVRTISRFYPAALFALAVISWGFAESEAQPVPDYNGGLTGGFNGSGDGSTSALPAADFDGDVETIYLALNKSMLVELPTRPAEVVVGEPGIADVEVTANDRIFVRGLGIGATNIYFLDGRGDVIRQAEVQVGIDTEGIQAAVNQLLPEETISISAHRDSLFLSGGVRSATSATQAVNIANRFVEGDVNVVNLIRILGSQQVVIQVRVAEMNRTASKSLGFNTTFERRAFGNRSISISSVGNLSTSFASGGLELGILGLTGVAYTALENNDLVRTLAEPTLTALSGQTASFLSGGETPVPTNVDDNGNVTIEYRQFGIQLGFTPTVQDAGRINLQIDMEISSQGNNVTINNTTVPQFLTKATETAVDLPSGGSIMLSGLIQSDETNSQDGTPGIMDIPLIGTLFRQTTQSQEQTELVVMVTAYLAKPIDSTADAALPTDGLKPATDLDLFVLGKLYGTYTGKRLPSYSEPLQGPFGYIME